MMKAPPLMNNQNCSLGERPYQNGSTPAKCGQRLHASVFAAFHRKGHTLEKVVAHHLMEAASRNILFGTAMENLSCAHFSCWREEEKYNRQSTKRHQKIAENKACVRLRC